MDQIREDNIAAAIARWQDGIYDSLTAAAREFDLPPSTVRDRYNGRLTRHELNNDEKKLTDVKEVDLVERIVALDDLHRAPTKRRIRLIVSFILREQGVY